MSEPVSSSATPSPAEIEKLVRDWSAHTLPFKEWTHRAHLTVALWHALNFSRQEALDRVRAGIQSYNLSQGVEQTLEGGYHETLTHFYMAQVQAYLTRCGPAPIEHLIAGLWDLCEDRKLPLRFYSRELLMSWPARTTYIEPDLAGLPEG